MVRLFVRHKVNDYAVWRKAYDGFEATRIKLGAKGHAVYRDVDDGNDVTAWHDFDNLEAAKAFSGSNELKGRDEGCWRDWDAHHMAYQAHLIAVPC